MYLYITGTCNWNSHLKYLNCVLNILPFISNYSNNYLQIVEIKEYLLTFITKKQRNTNDQSFIWKIF